MHAANSFHRNHRTPSDTISLAGTGAAYSASYSYDTLNRLTSSPLGSYTYGDSAHVDAATSIGSGSSAWTASYDASGAMTCRAPSGATTCAGTATGNVLSYNNEGQLASWQNAPSSPTATDTFLYDGEGNRVEQIATTSGTTATTSYVGALEEVTTSGASTTTTAYYGGVALSVNGALSYLLSDGLGSVSEAVSASSGAIARASLRGAYSGGSRAGHPPARAELLAAGAGDLHRHRIWRRALLDEHPARHGAWPRAGAGGRHRMGPGDDLRHPQSNDGKEKSRHEHGNLARDSDRARARATRS